MSSHKTLQEILKQRQQEEFVGRENQLAIFSRNLGLPVEHRRFIFNVSGQGGVGKTSLLRRFRQLIEANESLSAWSDEMDHDIPAVMNRMALALEKQGIDIKGFKERYKVYRQRRQELETDPDAPQGLPSFLGRTLAKTGIHLARRAPAVGIAFEFVDEETVATQAGEWLGYIAKKLANKDEVKLVQEPLEILTPMFLEVLHQTSDAQLIGLFFDTYERTGEHLDVWLRNIVNERYGGVPANIIISIAGQVELDRNSWAPYEGIIARLPLELFTVEEVREYLLRKGINNEQVVDVIINLSGQLPLLVATLASESPEDPARIGDPSGTAVERFLKWVGDPKKRQVALDCALPRLINEDILSVIIDTDNSSELFAWLRRMPFLRDGGLKYHPVVRTQILRHKLRNSPHSWSTLHGKLAEHHRTLRDDLALTSTNKHLNTDWQKHSLETIYHQLCQSPNSKITNALNQFLLFFDVSRRFAREWAETILQAGEDSENADVKSWGTKLTAGVKAFDEDENSEASMMFTELLEHGKIDSLSRSLSLDYRGSLYGRAELYDKALVDLNKAIELRPDHANYWMDLGELYRRMKNYVQAIDTYTKAISLKPKSTKALAGRGHAYLEKHLFPEALNDFSKALDLRANYAWALLGRGRVFAALRRLEEARQDFERAAHVNAEYEHVAQKEIGNLLMAARRYADASEAFVKALNAGPTCIECWTSLAQSFTLALTPEQTDVAMNEAVSIDLRSRNLLAYRAEAFRRVGLLNIAIRDFDEAVLADPQDLRALRGRVRTLIKMGRCDEALPDVNRLVEMEPNTANALLLRGETLLQMKKPIYALNDLERVLGLDKGSVHIVQQRIGMAFMQLGRAVDAQSAFTEALTAEPACTPCWIHLAKASSKLVVWEDIPACLEEVRIPNISSPMIMGCKGEALLTMGFYGKALLAIEKAISLDPNLFLRLANSYGLVLCCHGRFSDAVDVYVKTLERSNSTVTLYNLAVAKVRAHGLESATAHIDRAETALIEDLKLPNGKGTALYGLAGLSALRDEKSKALMLLEQAVKLEPASLRWLRQDAAWQDVRNDPRVESLLQKHEMEDSWDIAD